MPSFSTISGTTFSLFAAIKMVLSPAIVPAISSQCIESTASAAAFAESDRVLRIIRFAEAVMLITESLNILKNLSYKPASALSTVAYF